MAWVWGLWAREHRDQLAHTHANFRPESFLACYSSNPGCVPHFKSLAPTAAKISRGSQNFWRASRAGPHPPLNLVLKVVFGMLFVESKLCTKFQVASFNSCTNN